MKIEQPPVHPRHDGRRPEDIDGLLRGFLRSEMPDPWPVMKAPSLAVPRTRRPSASPWSRFGSRFALAATVGLCLVGSLLLAMAFPSDSASRLTPRDDPISPNPYEEFFRDKTPGGQAVKGVERHKGKTTIITIERIPLPMDEDED